MSSISNVGSFQNPPQVALQGGAKGAQNSSAPAQAAPAATPSDTNDVNGAVDVKTQALINPNLSNSQALGLSAQISGQLSGQSASIANRSPQALQTAFAA